MTVDPDAGGPLARLNAQLARMRATQPVWAGLPDAPLASLADLAVLPVLVALVVSIPLGFLVYRTGRAANVILSVLGVIYSIPSLALFVALPVVLGTQILDPLNIAVALAIYSVALLVRSVTSMTGSPASTNVSANATGSCAPSRTRTGMTGAVAMISPIAVIRRSAGRRRPPALRARRSIPRGPAPPAVRS